MSEVGKNDGPIPFELLGEVVEGQCEFTKVPDLFLRSYNSATDTII